jgi:hypothetical protein
MFLRLDDDDQSLKENEDRTLEERTGTPEKWGSRQEGMTMWPL